MNGQPVYVLAARRTSIGRVGGLHSGRSVDTLAAGAIVAVLDDLDARPGDVGEVVLGNVWGPGGNPARVAALAAGLGDRVPGMTLDVQCASGLAAIDTGARLVASGAVDLCLAGGVESMSTAPFRAERTEEDVPGRYLTRARFTPAPCPDPDMSPAADAVAARYGISRERQDAFAARSHRLAVAALAAGRYAPELAHLDDGPTVTPGHGDESPRGRFTAAALARLAPVHGPDGTVTIGSTAPFADGAAVVALGSASVRERLAVGPVLRVVDGVTVGVDPMLPGVGPISAVRRLLDGPGRPRLDDVQLIELTEAFAGQALACLDGLGLDVTGSDDDRINIGGGALALGHPWGASGAVLVARLFTELVRAPLPDRRDGSGTAIATVAGAGGSAVASLFERVS
jgi:acetyl-CoA C-acetyltransferase